MPARNGLFDNPVSGKRPVVTALLASQSEGNRLLKEYHRTMRIQPLMKMTSFAGLRSWPHSVVISRREVTI
jgi:hypothetical protein